MPDDSPLALSGKFRSLPLYDIENILIDRLSCEARGIQVADSFPGIICNRGQVLDCLNTSDVVLEA